MSIEQELQRRKIYQAMIEQAMQPGSPYSVVSGRVVPNPMEGISKIAKAYMGRKGIEESEAREKQAGIDEAQAYQDAITTMQGIPGVAEGNKQSAISQMVGDERIGSALKQALIKRELGLSDSEASAYTRSGYEVRNGVIGLATYDGRTGKEISFEPGREPVSQSVDLQASIVAERERRKLEEQMKVQAEKDRQAAEAARLKAEAEKRGEGAGIEATQDVIAEAERKKAYNVQKGKDQAEIDVKLDKSLNDFDNIYDETKSLLQQGPTSTWVGQIRDIVANQAFDIATHGAKIAAKLDVLGAKLTSTVPRLGGNESNIDLQFYKDQAAQVANRNLHPEVRLGALEALNNLMSKYKRSESGVYFKDKETKGSTDMPNQTTESSAPKKRLKYNRQTGKME